MVGWRRNDLYLRRTQIAGEQIDNNRLEKRKHEILAFDLWWTTGEFVCRVATGATCRWKMAGYLKTSELGSPLYACRLPK